LYFTVITGSLPVIKIVYLHLTPCLPIYRDRLSLKEREKEGIKTLFLPKPVTMTEKTIHEGRNVKRIREMLGMKQDALAMELGLSQQAVSALEQKEKIDDKILADVAKILKVPAEAIRNMTDDSAASFINTFNDNSINNGPLGNYQCTFNLLDKYVEQVEENKRLYQELVKEKDEKIALLQKMLDLK
jgi:transcriptional regulator with XRE-family HTH domain